MGEPGKHQFGSITLGSRGGASQGQLTIDQQGIVWRKSGGGRKLEVPKKDIESLEWVKIPRGGTLNVRQQNKPTSVFAGFREQDYDKLRDISNASFGQDLKEVAMPASGRNWGDAIVDNESLQFNVGSKPLFSVALPDVTQVQQGKDEVMLEFLPDTAAAEKEDALCEMMFYVPRDNERYAGDEETPASKVFLDSVAALTGDAGDTADPVATFDTVQVLAPRGRFSIELYMNYMKLVGQNQDYRVQYDALQRVFVLPKPHSPHTLVVAALDPPIRKGQTHYAHVLAHFHTDEEVTLSLEMTQEQIDAKNEKHKGKLANELTGPSGEVFAKALRGLSGARLTRPGQFRSVDDTPAVRCSYKADDGYLYPLERAFFYVHKPPLLLLHEDVETVEFCRQGGGGAASTKTFDLAIRDRSDQEYLFRGIQKGEWTSLFQFISVKGLPVANLAEAERGPGGATRTLDLDLGDDVDTGLARMEADDEDESEDEDFEGGGAEDEDDDDDDSGSSDAEEAPAPKPKKRPAASDGGEPTPKKAKPKAPKEKKEKPVKLNKDGKPKKTRAKKDKNAPKNAMSAFMFFSNAMREKVKADNPGIAFGEVGKKLGELWRGASAEEKAEFEEKAAADKERAKREKAEYAAKQAGGGEDEDAADADDDAGGDEDAGGDSD